MAVAIVSHAGVYFIPAACTSAMAFCPFHAGVFAIGAVVWGLVLKNRRAAKHLATDNDGADIVVSDLHVYPVKGLRGHRVSTTEIDALGLLHDRRYMIVEINHGIDPSIPDLGFFHTQRSLAAMATLTPIVTSAGGTEPVPMSSATPATGLRLTIDDTVNSIGATALAAAGLSTSAEAPLVTAAQVLGSSQATPAGCCLRPVRVWSSTVADAVDQGDDIGRWLSTALSYPNLRLVYMDQQHKPTQRFTSAKWLPFGSLVPYLPPSVVSFLGSALSSLSRNVSFADGYPILLANRSSLDDLNRRIVDRAAAGTDSKLAMAAAHDPFIGKPTPMNRFRPNVVVAAAGPARSLRPWAEDTWTGLEIVPAGSGNSGISSAPLRLAGVKRCDRCLVTTTDHLTGRRGDGDAALREPLATLSSFRSSVDGPDNGIFFAINCVPEIPARVNGNARISVGDRVIVTKTGVMGPL